MEELYTPAELRALTQNSPEWLVARRGRCTASRCADVIGRTQDRVLKSGEVKPGRYAAARYDYLMELEVGLSLARDFDGAIRRQADTRNPVHGPHGRLLTGCAARCEQQRQGGQPLEVQRRGHRSASPTPGLAQSQVPQRCRYQATTL